MSSLTKKSPPNNKNDINFTTSCKKNSSYSQRTPSFSSTSSYSSNNSSSSRSSSLEEYFSSSRIPFSWETIPGIPKKHTTTKSYFQNDLNSIMFNTQNLKKIDSSRKLPYKNDNFLPLPPPVSATAYNKNNNQKKNYITRRDPFFDALVEVSKGDSEDDNDSIWKPSSKNLSTRFGFSNMSCKNSSNIVESLVFLPRSGPKRISYDVLKKRSG